MKRHQLILGASLATVALSLATVADASGHELVVDGVNYDSTKEAGDSIHWETPGPRPASASFAERGQTWAPGDNGSEHLPCEFGEHWISNENVLTISNCLDNPNPTTTTTEVTTSTTSTVSDTTSTTALETSTTAPTTTSILVSSASTITIATESTSTSSPSTSSPSTLSPSFPSTSTLSPTASTTIAPKLPATGSNGLMAVYAAALLALGAAAVLAARRRV